MSVAAHTSIRACSPGSADRQRSCHRAVWTPCKAFLTPASTMDIPAGTRSRTARPPSSTTIRLNGRPDGSNSFTLGLGLIPGRFGERQRQPDMGRVVVDADRASTIIALVCHGQAALLSARDETGRMAFRRRENDVLQHRRRKSTLVRQPTLCGSSRTPCASLALFARRDRIGARSSSRTAIS